MHYRVAINSMESKKIKILEEILHSLQPFAIAFSGGNDSTFLTAIAKQFGLHFCTIHCISEFTITSDTQRARTFAHKNAINYYEINVSVLDVKEIVNNPSNRCYFCKTTLFKRIQDFANESGFPHVVDASNLTDNDDYRPGKRALIEQGVRLPLAEAGITKNDIVAELQRMNISFSKTSNSCLATRIPYKTAITKDILETIKKAEEFVASLGFEGVRVRYHYPIARIEVIESQIEKMLEPLQRKKIIAFFKTLGFLYVTIDLEGFNSGNLNRMVQDE